ncbi:MAG TPA: class I SAM-dependent DNA methyltransferase, partial [Spirochaetota bacterium]|nr:class I SAM-dependent DNA methyltransferase [Spirochaetota bacterium]
MDDVVRILEDIINDFDVNKFKNFFYKKTNDFISQDKPLDGCNDELFDESTQIGTFKVNDVHEFIVIAAKVNKELTQKSGKKAQYTFAKKILKQMIQYTGGFFIFYDSNGNFRFSFIYSIPRPDGKQDWSNFRRYTYYVSKDQTNRTFLQQMQAASFESLEKIIDAFSVEKVTKEFYRNIVELYYTLINNYNNKGLQRFPKEDQNEKEEFAIRLLGRLLFCWFLKMKKDGSKDSLIPQKYLSSELVKNFNGDYYHEYVEPLFFQILNKPLKERLEKYKTKSYSLIPFLNGGLFEPHDSDYYPVTAINEMGISPNINILTISNDWFANLFEVFERYNFTIDENTLVDTEVSIDPEMLGKIFENLLAEYNPETKENARKATGSYYTPREIVDYMVDESLKNYLCEKTKLSRDIIEELLKHENFEAAANLNEHDKEAIIDAIDKIKVIDPACGSGAFPMGILHKLQVILENVDPQSKIWFKKKIGQIVDPLLQKELQIKLEEENWDYIHKLGLIQHSIYGVDIQPIAVEISKLRFFLSLIVDEKIDDEKQNRGIIPLPNLEFKFVAANTLIG